VLVRLRLVSEPIDQLLFSEYAVLLGQFVNAFPFALFLLSFAIGNIDPQIYQVANELGAKGFYRFRKITFPLSFGAVVGSFLVTFAIGLGAMVEVDFLSQMRCSIGHTVAGLWLARRPELAAAGSLLVWLVSFVLLWVGAVMFRRKQAWRIG
jgi:ABC-type spermidine/putrescine transport system permease subunit I